MIDLCARFPKTHAGQHAAEQLIDAATSVAANYRATCIARTHAEFAAKIGVVSEEADECVGWLRLAVAEKMIPEHELTGDLQEARELARIFFASHQTAKERKRHAEQRNRRWRRDFYWEAPEENPDES